MVVEVIIRTLPGPLVPFGAATVSSGEIERRGYDEAARRAMDELRNEFAADYTHMRVVFDSLEEYRLAELQIRQRYGAEIRYVPRDERGFRLRDWLGVGEVLVKLA